MGTVCMQVTQVWDVGELECHHAVKAERLKWEACEARLVSQLEALTGSGQVEPQDPRAVSPVVRLIQATRLSSRHVKLARARVLV